MLQIYFQNDTTANKQVSGRACENLKFILQQSFLAFMSATIAANCLVAVELGFDSGQADYKSKFFYHSLEVLLRRRCQL